MASRRPRPGRLLLPTILAAVLAGEITGIALGRGLPPVVVPVPAAPSQVDVARSPVSNAALPAGAKARDDRGELIRIGVDLTTRQAPVAASVGTGRGLSAAPRASSTPTAPRSTGSSAPKAPASAPHYRGVNHVWIPSLGINKAVQSFPCSRSRPPDAGVYRWGCAGRNNVYLLAHAWSTFKPLHDAYVRGTLRKGMRVWYADGGGRVHAYSVIWWRVTPPTTAASWAWASLSSPGMTLQTCVGANSAYRLMVRLTRVG